MNFKIKLTKKGWLALILGLFIALIVLIIAYIFGLIALIIGIITLIIQSIWLGLVWLATQLGLLGIISWITTQITALIAWFASTWLGSLFLPVYNWLIPIFSKLTPFLTAGKWGKKLWQKTSILKKRSSPKEPIKANDIIIEHDPDT